METIGRLRFYFFLAVFFSVWAVANALVADDAAPAAQEFQPILTVQTGHPGGFSCSAISKDGLLGLTGGGNGEIWLWDLRTCKGLHRFVLTAAPEAIAFSAKSNEMFLAGDGNVVNLWDMASEQILRSFVGHAKPITAMRMSSDGRYLLTGSRDKTARLWDVSKAAQLQKFQCQAIVRCVDISSDGRLAAAASEDGIIQIWNTGSGNEVHQLKGHNGVIQCLQFSPDGSRVLSGGDDKLAILWDAVTGKEVCRCEGHSRRICGVGFSGNGDHLLTASDDKSVRIWDAVTGKETKLAIKRFGPDRYSVLIDTRRGGTGPTSPVPWTVSFSLNGEIALATPNNFATPRAWNVSEGRQVGELKGTAVKPHVIGFLHEGRQLRTGIRVWDLTTGDQVGVVEWDADKGTEIASSPDERYKVTSHDDKTLRLWDISTGNEIRRISEELLDENRAALLPNAEKLLVVGKSSLRILDMSTGREIRRFQGPMHDGKTDVNCVAVSPDGKYAATGGKDMIIRVWDLETGKEFQNCQGHSGQINTIKFSPDGRQVLSGSGDTTVRLWDIASGKEVARMKGHTGFITQLAFSPDGSQVLTGSIDHNARLFERNTGRLIHTLKGHVSGITSVCFSPDSRRLLTASDDRTVAIWDSESGKELCRLISFENGEWAVVDKLGRYDASNGGEVEGLHWIVGNERIDLCQLKNRYYEPRLLAKIMGFNKEPLRDAKEFTAPKLYPQVELTAPTGEHPTLVIRLTDRGGGVGPVVVKINGKELTADARGGGARPDAGKMELDVGLGNDPRLKPGEQNVIEVSAFNSEGYLRSRGERVFYTPPGKKVQNQVNMWAIVVGVSKYANDAMKLRYAAKDAEDFAKALDVAGGRLFGVDCIHVALLTTDAQSAYLPTRANLEREFDSVAKKAKSGDILVVYLAGHGVNYGGPDGDFYYLTCEAATAELNDPEIRRQTAISSEEMTEWIKKIRTTDKQVVILDTCAAAKLGEKFAEKREVPSSQIRSLQRVKDRTGIHVLSGCAADEVSYEASQYGQGLLTYSLLFGMQGAALRENQYVDVLRLFGFTQDQVPQLAQGIGGIQKPVLFSPEGGSFDIGRLTTEQDKAEIPLQTKRPVMLRTNFQEEEGYRDTLGLAKYADERLMEESVRGPKTSPVFIDAEEFPDACQLFGRYKMDGKKVIVNVNLFKGRTKMASFSVSGDVTHLDLVAKQITEETLREFASLRNGEDKH